MSLSLRYVVAFALGGLAFIACPSGSLLAQTPEMLKRPAPARLPVIDRRILDQLPPGCTGSWASLDQPRAASAEAADSQQKINDGYSEAKRSSSPPRPRLNPFAIFASQLVPPSDTEVVPPPAADELLPAPKAEKPKPIAKPQADSGDDLLAPEEGLDDPLLKMRDRDLSDEKLLDGDMLDGDLGGQDEKDPLSDMTPTPRQIPAKLSPAELGGANSKDAIAAVHALDSQYPSAQTCAKCHPKHFDEWRVSGHAYASVSPMFQRFEQAMQDLTEGTVGSFCVRCHAPIATQLCTPPSVSILEAPPVVREGITCVACHRVQESIGRTHGDRRIEPGDIHAPIYGASNGAGVREAISKANELKLKLSAADTGPGQAMHQHCGPFEPVTRSDFCASCHQVAVHPGIWLEIVHAQYRSGPAHEKGITCQQCHMGSDPGKPTGYELAHCAELNGKPFGEPRKHSNHIFWGPGYSIAHPGVFPHNPDANRYTPRQWLAFEYRSGWGTPEFERSVAPGTVFPAPWDKRDDRIDGRKVIDANLRKLGEKREAATLTLAAGAQVDGPSFAADPMASSPLRFTYRVANISEGHNMPTGSLGAQPQMWLNVALIDPQGNRIWETGYLDKNGDLADLQSVEVNYDRLNVDSQLFNLQTKFLINNVRGTDREAPVPLNFSLDQLVFLRPGAIPVSVLNHPPLIRMEAHSIPPLDHRIASYVVPAELMTNAGLYRLSVRLRSRPEPPYFMRLVGASPEMIRRLNENIIDIETDSHTFAVQSPVQAAMPKRFLLR